MPNVALAATISNTATVTAPTGAIEANTTNNSATDTDTLLATIVAANDTLTGVSGIAAQSGLVNVFANDTINGAAASSANSTLAIASTSSLPSQLTFDTATGAVGVKAGTPAGDYTFTYTICETANPTNCKDATVTISVVAATIAADADSVAGINGTSGATDVLDVIPGDTLGGTQLALSDVNLTVQTPATPATTGAPVPTLDTATGKISVPAGTPAGSYDIVYKICEKLNPANCTTAIATVTVVGGPIVATDDSVSNISGLTAQSNVLNAFTGDTINGVAASSSNATLAVAATSSLPSQLTFDTTTGAVGVKAGTPAGTYTFKYTICEKLNPTNCKDATISVTVIAATIAADPDSVSGVNGASGSTDVLDVLAGDTINGTQVTTSDVILTVQTPATPATTGAPVPTLNTTTGMISVPPGTPAGTYDIVYKVCEALNPDNCTTGTASVTVAPSVDLSVTKTNNTTEVFSGQSISYTITVSNAGPDAATGALIKDTPGAGLTCPATGGITFGGTGAPTGSFTVGDLTGTGITLGTIPNGQSVTITYSCTVN